MNDYEKQFEQIVSGLNIEDRPNAEHKKALRQQMLAAGKDTASEKTTSRIQPIWRRIMKSNITQFAAAAILMIAAFVGINLLSGTPAWAMEQTIEALENIRGIYLAGVARYDGQDEVNFEIWARPHSQDPSLSGDFRLHEGDNHVSVASEDQNLTFVYTKNSAKNAVYITEGLNRNCNPFPGSNLFRQFKELATNWKEEYRKDPETGRDCVFVSFEGPPLNTARYWQLQCDLETKLPVRLSVWWDEWYSGKPHYDFRTITYNPEISEELFEFHIPEGAQVVDCRPLHQLLDEHPEYGLEVNPHDVYQACRQVTLVYWQAVINQDYAKVRNIRPLLTDDALEELSAIYAEFVPIKLIDIEKMNHLADPGAFSEVTCLVETADSKIAKSILNVAIRQTDHGSVGAVAGAIGPEMMVVE